MRKYDSNDSRREREEIRSIRKKFGIAVRGQRRQLGFSQEELAERAGLHRTYITDIENGIRNISLEDI